MFYMPQENFSELGCDEEYGRLILNVDDGRHDDVYAY